MNKILIYTFVACSIGVLISCKDTSSNKESTRDLDSSLVNTSHLDYLNTPVTFPNGVKASGIYIYAEAPDYHFVTDSDEGFTCVDDVARAAQVYFRINAFSSDTAAQRKVFNLIRFILEMQSDNGYFYNFLFPGDSVNTVGKTSVNEPGWWSWRALYTLTEAAPLIRGIDAAFADKINAAIDRIVIKIKSDLATIPITTKLVNGIRIPQWLPAGSGTDQAAILILGLIPYCETHNDSVMANYVKRLADGIVMMQQGDSTQFPFSCFLSWENIWHAYGNDQAHALFRAATFLKDSLYERKALAEVNNFYPWLLKNGFKSSFSVTKRGNLNELMDEKRYAQIAYGIRPMVFAAVEAYQLSGEQKYADIAGHIAAWLLGANETETNIYDQSTGRCYDGIIGKDSVNYNSGAESTIEALLALQKVEKHPAVLQALQRYKKP